MLFQRRFIFLPFVLVLGMGLVSCGGNESANDPSDDTLGQFGSELNVAEFDNAPEALPVLAFNRTRGPLPSSVLLTNLPPIATQGTPPKPLGSPGSCEAQSFAYGLGSYTNGRNPNGSIRWDITNPDNLISAAFQYRYQHFLQGKTCPSGSLAIPYLDRIVAEGSPSAADFAYRADCAYLDSIPTNPVVNNPERFRLGSFSTFQVRSNPDAALQQIKEYVANGQAVAFSGLVLEGYSAPQMTNGVIYTHSTIPNSGHGQFVVGYDDTIGDPANPGALLIQNSFGPQWPPPASNSVAPPGMAWWSYGTFKATQMLCAVAYPRIEARPSGAKLFQSTPNAPECVMHEAYQHASNSAGPVYLIANIWMQEPIVIVGVAMVEPTSGTKMSGVYSHHLGNGNLYFKRADGFQFMTGDYQIEIVGTTLNDTPVTYSGVMRVGASTPASPPFRRISTSAKITDATGAPAKIN